jgi:hypothetical protein
MLNAKFKITVVLYSNSKHLCYMQVTDVKVT